MMFNSIKIPAAGFVLVGGQSRRMGCDKALLELEGIPMLLRAADLLQAHLEQVILLGPRGRYGDFALPVVEDARPGRGPLGALHTGLQHSSYSWNFFVACDLPYLKSRLVELLLCRAFASSAQAVVPVAGGRLQPLCAAYHQNCLPVIETMLRRGRDLSLFGLHALLRLEAVTPGPHEDRREWEKMFTNLNTPEEWLQLQPSAAVKIA